MRWIWQKIGIVAFWAAFPALIIYLRRNERTRVAITCQQKLLVAKTWLGNGKWALPGGGLHAGEEPLIGLLREVAEETGIMLGRTQVKHVFTEEYRYYGIHFPCHYFFVGLPEMVPLKAQFLEIFELTWIDQDVLDVNNANADVLRALGWLNKKAL
jgi:8-oxo-dGTP pyrophosphatase MutT (NUDIX family)